MWDYDFHGPWAGGRKGEEMEYEIDDTLLSSQYNDLVRRTDGLTSEQKLLLAVLEDALACWTRTSTVPSRNSLPVGVSYKEWLAAARDFEHEEANRWIFENDGMVLTFDGLCSDLNIDATALRVRLKQWQASRATAIPDRQHDGRWGEKKKIQCESIFDS